MRRSIVLTLVSICAVSCSSNGGTGGAGGTTGTGTTTGATTATNGSTTSGTTTGTASTTTATTTGTTTASSTGTGLPCPDETGAYSAMEVGQGCGDVNVAAMQCIKANGTCDVHLVSPTSTGGECLNGPASLDMSGNFTNGMIIMGTVQRSGCTGTWNAANNTLAVNCGGPNPSSQMCTVTLTRTSATCPF